MTVIAFYWPCGTSLNESACGSVDVAKFVNKSLVRPHCVCSLDWWPSKVFWGIQRHICMPGITLTLYKHIPNPHTDRTMSSIKEIRMFELPLDSRFTFKLLPVVDWADIYEMLCQHVSAGFTEEPCVKHYGQSEKIIIHRHTNTHTHTHTYIDI